MGATFFFSGNRSQIFDMPSASGNKGTNIFKKQNPDFSTSPQLVGTWVQNIFRKLVPDFLTCPQLVTKWVHVFFFQDFGPGFSVSRWNLHYLNANCHMSSES